MPERATENTDTPTPVSPAPAGDVITPRFARDPEHFAVERLATGTEGGQR